jgi:hypothetical protein
MTDVVRRACRDLAAACEFAHSADIERYSAAVEVLREHPSPAVLDVLLAALRDHDGGEVQYELVEACEAYPADVYIPALVQHLPRLRDVAPWWGRLLLQSVLNSPECHPPLTAALAGSAVPVRAAVVAWLSEVAAESPQYRELLSQFGGG